MPGYLVFVSTARSACINLSMIRIVRVARTSSSVYTRCTRAAIPQRLVQLLLHLLLPSKDTAYRPTSLPHYVGVALSVKEGFVL